jgi:hypothetical protein
MAPPPRVTDSVRSSWRHWLVGWVVVLIALAIRLAVAGPAKVPVSGDAAEYLRLGKNLALGHGYSLAAQAPFWASDWRMPAYPAVIALADWSHLGPPALPILNALLGVLAVWGILLISREVFGQSDRATVWAGMLAALYPTMVTYVGLAYSENLSVAATVLLIYVVFFASWSPSRVGWVVKLGATASLLVLTRPEGVLVASVAVFVCVLVRRPPSIVAAMAIGVVLLAPITWATRNFIEFGRFELTDPTNSQVTVLLTFDGGNFSDATYIRGVRIGYQGAAATPEERKAYTREMTSFVAQRFKAAPASIITYKAKSLLNFPFSPPVWTWAAQRDYGLSEAIRHLDATGVARIVWSTVLIVEYALATVGIVAWRRTGRSGWAAGILLYPACALALAIPFHSELRLWFAAALLLVVPAVEGGRLLWRRARHDGAG